MHLSSFGVLGINIERKSYGNYSYTFILYFTQVIFRDIFCAHIFRVASNSCAQYSRADSPADSLSIFLYIISRDFSRCFITTSHSSILCFIFYVVLLWGLVKYILREKVCEIVNDKISNSCASSQQSSLTSFAHEFRCRVSLTSFAHEFCSRVLLTSFAAEF